MILVPTIRHTGSHFILDLLGSDVGCAKNPGQQDGTPGEIIWDHVDANLKFFADLGSRHPMVIPLRHPKVAAASWRGRGKDQKVMISHFRMVLDHLDPLDPLYLPIDSEDRTHFLNEIRNELDMPLKTNWEPLGVRKSTHSWRHTDHIQGIDSAVYDFIADTRSFWDRFYDA